MQNGADFQVEPTLKYLPSMSTFFPLFFLSFFFSFFAILLRTVEAMTASESVVLPDLLPFYVSAATAAACRSTQ